MKEFFQQSALIIIVVGGIFGVVSQNWLLSIWLMLIGLINYIVWEN